MAKTVVSLLLIAPPFDPDIDEGQTFNTDAGPTLTGNHLADYDAHAQWDQGTSTWVDLDSDTGKGLSSPATNPQTNLTSDSIAAITVTGNIAGSYEVRWQTVDHNDGDATDTSRTETITVSAAGGARRVMVVS